MPSFLISVLPQALIVLLGVGVGVYFLWRARQRMDITDDDRIRWTYDDFK